MILRAQIFISAVIRTTGSTQSIRETRYWAPRNAVACRIWNKAHLCIYL